MSRRGTAWLLSAGAALTLLVSLVLSPDRASRTILCPLRRWFGLSCPGCGLTRAFCSISRGELERAFDFNPFGFVFYALALYFLVRPLLPARVLEREERWMKTRQPGIAALVFAGALLLFGLVRLVGEIVARTGA
jgi:hypothetical protein